jgi:LuxR family transcriptional regulator, maltose regulon positive regulatory protein
MPISRRRLPKHALDRPRLLRRLEASEAQVVAVIAPAGYGKTTLLAQFAALSKRPVVWLTLDDSAADSVALADALAAELMLVFPRAKFAAWKAATALGALPSGLAAALAKDMNRLQRNALVVLDRLERLSSESSKWLETWLGGLLDGHMVCLAGYADSAFPIARLVADGGLLLEAQDLAFTPQETAAYLKSRGFEGNTLKAHQSLEGWAVGLSLLAASKGVSVEPKGLMLEVLKRLSPRVRETIAEASVLEVWSEVAAREIGCIMPKGWLSEALKVGLPLVVAGTGEYRPHTVLLETLIPELKSQSKRFSSLHRQVAERAEASGQDLLALRHFHLAGFESGMLRVLERIVPILFSRREYLGLQKHLQIVPEHRLTEELKIIYANNLIEIGESDKGKQMLLQLITNGNQAPFLYYLLTLMEYRSGNGQQALEYADQGLALLGDLRNSTRIRLLVAKSGAFQMLRQSEQDLLAAQEAVAIAEEIQDLSMLSLALSLVAPSYGDLGDRVPCETTFRRSIDLAAQLGFPIRQIQDFNNFSAYLGEWGRVEEAMQMADMGIPIARRENSVFLPILLGTRGLQQWRLGNLVMARADCKEALELYPSFSLDYMATVTAFNLVQIELLLDQFGIAENMFLELKQKAIHSEGRLYFLEGLLAFSVSDLILAKKSFLATSEYNTIWDAPRQKMYLVEIARLEGVLTFEMVADAIAVLEKLGHCRPLTMDMKFLSGLYKECISQGWFVDIFTEALLPPNNAHLLSVPFEVQLFAKFNVQLLGAPFIVNLTKSKELLAWLVLHGASTRDEIVQALWGDATDKRNLEYFKVAMRKLRVGFSEHQSVTFDAVTFENGVYVLHPRLQVLCAAKNILDARDDFPSDTSVLEFLFLGYKGVFLSGIDSPWVVETRSVLLDAVVSIGEQLGLLLLKSDVFKAIRIFKRVLELDAFSDVALRGLQSQVRLPVPHAEARVLA